MLSCFAVVYIADDTISNSNEGGKSHGTRIVCVARRACPSTSTWRVTERLQLAVSQNCRISWLALDPRVCSHHCPSGVSECSILLGGIGVLFIGCTKLIIPFFFRHIHLYVYSNGLLYINRNTSRVARWEQVEGIDGGFIDLKNEKSIMMPQYFSGYKELRSTIMREIENYTVSIGMDENSPAL